MLTLTIVPAFGAQMEFRMLPEEQNATATVKFQRTIWLEYENGGQLADELRGKKVEKTFSVTSDEIRDRINYYLKNTGQSDAAITNVQVDYHAQLTGRGINTSIDYKIVLTLDLQGHILREYSGSSPALVDMDWRGFIVDGPIDLDIRGVNNEINLPISFIAQAAPSLYSAVKGSEAEVILNYPLIDSTGIKAQPLGNWHFLFDPTGINVDASTFGLSDELAGRVWSSFTMGESSFREGIQIEKTHEATFTADKSYIIRAIESADSANVHIGGFASVDVLGNSEVFGVSPRTLELLNKTNKSVIIVRNHRFSEIHTRSFWNIISPYLRENKYIYRFYVDLMEIFYSSRNKSRRGRYDEAYFDSKLDR